MPASAIAAFAEKNKSFQAAQKERKEIIDNMKALRERAQARGYWTPETKAAYGKLQVMLQKIDEMEF